jgi:hypothetical protein
MKQWLPRVCELGRRKYVTKPCNALHNCANVKIGWAVLDEVVSDKEALSAACVSSIISDRGQ